MAHGRGAGVQNVERHEADSYRLRAELEELYNQACAALRGERSRSVPKKTPADMRAERDAELTSLNEQIEFFQRDIRVLKRQVEGSSGVYGDHDPMELQNLIAERRAEAIRLAEEEDVLERIAEQQCRAEKERSILSPDVAQRLRRVKDEVEREKQRHLQLRETRASTEEELKAKRGELWGLERQLQRNMSAIKQTGAPSGKVEMNLRKLQRHVDSLSEAIHQDEKKHRAAARDAEKLQKGLRDRNASVREAIAKREAEVQRLRAKLASGAGGPLSPRSEDEDSTPGPSPRNPAPRRPGRQGGKPSPRAAAADRAFQEHEAMKREIAEAEMEEELACMNSNMVEGGMQTIDLLQQAADSQMRKES